ncbi:hypothetical protein PHMEG_0009078 [Phytophthora megakarya]|uniref:Uncharacterized protein n=1 Tax=Phytophthora megakarya TaxID=4795 RepID=A0A225WH26_9STRA|nr:hypothetical protein PHMEG_0009078 [Phytophthora megakarya]
MVTCEHSETISDTPRTELTNDLKLKSIICCLVECLLRDVRSFCLSGIQTTQFYESFYWMLFNFETTTPILHNRGLLNISTYAEMMEWTSDKMCTTLDHFLCDGDEKDINGFSGLEPSYQDELLVLNAFHETLDNGKISLGIVCTIRHPHHEICGATDGTYRLAANNWTLIAFGCTGVSYNGPDGFLHRFHPFAYLLLLQRALVGYCATKLLAAHGPKLPRQNHLLEVASRYDLVYKTHAHYLHKVRNAAQFRALAKLMLQNWSDLGENVVVTWFMQQYLSPK